MWFSLTERYVVMIKNLVKLIHQKIQEENLSWIYQLFDKIIFQFESLGISLYSSDKKSNIKMPTTSLMQSIQFNSKPTISSSDLQ